MSTKVYEEIKYLALKFPQLIPKEDFIQIIGHISSDVILTHQLNNALVVFDTDEDKCDYLKNYSKPLKKTGKFSPKKYICFWLNILIAVV